MAKAKQDQAMTTFNSSSRAHQQGIKISRGFQQPLNQHRTIFNKAWQLHRKVIPSGPKADNNACLEKMKLSKCY
ncbi:hypothetical protein COLO4_20616 [Corchorus olitorius]|uniref:Uncharacterized protein n=1 Tax=Corchorus olitorius TaxID=93759 RepID=A0A1R3IYQ6_9ROSI|nr:hypothetical protein COLO4_20616 [Corchorus olitorius]